MALRKGTTLEYLHQDHLGGSFVSSDSSGATKSTTKYLPYGGTRASGGALGTDRKFTGQRLDGSGLYYYGARYYDAGIGRFISPDPVVAEPWNPQALNRYSYVINNPLKYTDPTGLYWVTTVEGAYEVEEDPGKPPPVPTPLAGPTGGTAPGGQAQPSLPTTNTGGSGLPDGIKQAFQDVIIGRFYLDFNITLSGGPFTSFVGITLGVQGGPDQGAYTYGGVCVCTPGVTFGIAPGQEIATEAQASVGSYLGAGGSVGATSSGQSFWEVGIGLGAVFQWIGFFNPR